jgi:glutamate racemase
VIDPGAELACKTTENNLVGLIATEATVKSQVYQNKILALKPEANISAVACPLFVPLVEEGWHDDPVTNIIVFRYLNSLKEKQIDTLIMGCTHYPILEKSIQNVMGRSVKLIDSGRALAHKLKDILIKEQILSSPDPHKKNLILGFTDFNTKMETTTLNILAQGLDSQTLAGLNLRFEIVSLN